MHHQPDGTPYPDPNELAHAVCDAARAAGIRLVLLLTAYARAGRDLPPTPGSGASATPRSRPTWPASTRCATTLEGEPLITVGYAPHSVRAVPRDWLEAIGRHAAETGLPVHVHADEQPA